MGEFPEFVKTNAFIAHDLPGGRTGVYRVLAAQDATLNPAVYEDSVTLKAFDGGERHIRGGLNIRVADCLREYRPATEDEIEWFVTHERPLPPTVD